MATRETKRSKPVTKRLAKADAPAAKPRTRRLTKSLAPLPGPELAIPPAEPLAPALLVPDSSSLPPPAPTAASEPAPPPPEPAPTPPAPPPTDRAPAPERAPFAPIVRSTGGSRRALDTGAGAWVSVVYEGGATFCDDQAGVFVNGTRTRLRAPIAERLLTLDGFRMP